jgi:hypothetical protein
MLSQFSLLEKLSGSRESGRDDPTGRLSGSRERVWGVWSVWEDFSPLSPHTPISPPCPKSLLVLLVCLIQMYYINTEGH